MALYGNGLEDLIGISSRYVESIAMTLVFTLQGARMSLFNQFIPQDIHTLYANTYRSIKQVTLHTDRAHL